MRDRDLIGVWSYGERLTHMRNSRCAYVYVWSDNVYNVYYEIVAVNCVWTLDGFTPHMVREQRGFSRRGWQAIARLGMLARDWCAFGVTWVDPVRERPPHLFTLNGLPPRGAGGPFAPRSLVTSFKHPRSSAAQMARERLDGKGPGRE